MTSVPLNIVWQRDLSLRRYWTDTAPDATTTPIMPREYGWISFLLSTFDLHHHLDGHYKVIAENPIVVLEGQNYNPEQVRSYLQMLRAHGSQVGIIHVGDEFGWAPLEVYDQATFVYRNYWRPEMRHLPDCHYLPLGVNCPMQLFEPNPLDDRPYAWSFAGQTKPSRHAMIDALSRRTDGKLIVNDNFNSGLSKSSYAQLLSDTQIVLCPRGWASVESYRLYEALEAGAVPLVEDDGTEGLFREHATLAGSWNALVGGPRYWYDLASRAFTPRYWRSAYGMEVPFPRIHRWENVDALLNRIDPVTLGNDVAAWWEKYKEDLRTTLFEQVQQKLLSPFSSPQLDHQIPVSSAVE